MYLLPPSLSPVPLIHFLSPPLSLPLLSDIVVELLSKLNFPVSINISITVTMATVMYKVVMVIAVVLMNMENSSRIPGEKVKVHHMYHQDTPVRGMFPLLV